MKSEGLRGRVDLPGPEEQGCQIAARTYRAWRNPSGDVAARTVTDAQVINTVRDLAWTVDAPGRRSAR